MDIEIKVLDIIGVLSPCTGVLKAIAENKDKDSNIFKSKGLEYIMKYKWDKYAKQLYDINFVMLLILWLLFNTNKLYITATNTESSLNNSIAEVLFIICFILSTYFMYYEFRCMNKLKKFYFK